MPATIQVRRSTVIRHGEPSKELSGIAEVNQGHPYAVESAILWYEGACDLRFVRVVNLNTCRSRAGSILLPTAGRVVGFAQLGPEAKPDAATGRFLRRVFYVLAEDAPLQNEGKPPANAVDPRRIGPRLYMERMTSAKPRAEHAKQDSDGLDQVDIDTLLEGELASAADTGIDAKANVAAQKKLQQESQSADYGYLDPIGGGDPVPLRNETLTIGRSSRSDIVLAFKNISARHCEMTLKSGYWFVEDKNSTNGVKINGTKIEPETSRRLDPGAKFSIGKHFFTIQYSPEDLGADGIPPAEETSREFMGVSLLNRIGLS